MYTKHFTVLWVNVLNPCLSQWILWNNMFRNEQWDGQFPSNHPWSETHLRKYFKCRLEKLFIHLLEKSFLYTIKVSYLLYMCMYILYWPDHWMFPTSSLSLSFPWYLSWYISREVLHQVCFSEDFSVQEKFQLHA